MATSNRIDFEAFLATQKFLKELDKIDKKVASTGAKLGNSFAPALQKANAELETMQKHLDKVQSGVEAISSGATSMAKGFSSAADSLQKAQRASSSPRGQTNAFGGVGQKDYGPMPPPRQRGANIYGGFGWDPYGPSQVNQYGGFGTTPYGPSPINRGGGFGYDPYGPNPVNRYGGWGTAAYGPSQMNQFGGVGSASYGPQLGPAGGSLKGIFTEFAPAVKDTVMELTDVDKVMEVIGTRAKSFLGTLSGQGGIVGAIGQGGSQLAGMAEAAGLTGAKLAAAGLAAAGIAGAVLGAVAAMKAMLDISKMVYNTFMNITDQAKEAAIQIDTARSGFESLFEGSVEMADSALEIVRGKSREMGADLTQLGRAFLPEMSTLEEFDKLAEVSAALAAYDPAQGAYGVNLALKDAMTGDFRSLRQRLEFSVPETDRIRAHMEANGNSIISMLDAIEVELERKGRSWEAFADTYAVQLGRVEQSWQYIKEEMGAPILDVQKQGFRNLADTMEENMELFTIFGEGIGRIRGYLEELKFSLYDALINVIVDNKDQIAAGLAFVEQLVFSIKTAGEAIIGALSGIFSRSELADGGPMRAFFSTVTGFVKHFVHEIIRAATIVENFFEMVTENADRLSTILDPDSTMEERALAILNMGDSFDVLGESVVEAEERIKEFDDAMDEIAENWVDSMNNMGQATSDFAERMANAFLELQAAEQVLGQAQADMEAMTSDFKSEMIQMNRDMAYGIQDSFVQLGRELIDLEEQTSQKREDAFRKNMQKIEDLHRKHGQDLRDAAADYRDDVQDAYRDWQRDEEDIRKKYNRKEIEAERDHNQAKIDAEVKFRDRLAEIRRKYEFDAAEAIRQNDAVALLRLKRKLEFDLNEARIARNQEQAEEDEAMRRKREERARDLAQELEDSRIARDRKIEDITIAYQREIEELKKNLARKLAEQKIALERELEEIAIAEERKREAIQLAHERRIEDLNTNMQRELEVLRSGLEAQVAVVEAAAKRMAAARANMMALTAMGMMGRTGASSRYENYMASRGRGSRTGTGSYSEQMGDDAGRVFTPGPASDYTPTTYGGYGRRYGGTVFPGMPVMVGEPRPGGRPNPEVFIPSSLGRIMPWTGQEGVISNTVAKQLRLVNRPPMSQQFGSYTDNTNMQIDLSDRIMDRFTPTQMRIIENVVAETMLSAKRRQGTRTRRF
jgi:hypothetical protein